MVTDTFHTIILVLVASVWGSMLFFAIVVAPSVFRFLEPATAGFFIRRLFPHYYLTLGTLCALATALLLFALPASVWDLVLLTLVTLGFVLARQMMMPKINSFRDAALAGDKSANQRFNQWHRASVILNAIQMLVILYLLVRLAL